MINENEIIERNSNSVRKLIKYKIFETGNSLMRHKLDIKI